MFIIFQNLGSFLPASDGGLSNTTRGASVVISSQVGERGSSQLSQALQNSPLSLNFSFNNVSQNVNFFFKSHSVAVLHCMHITLFGVTVHRLRTQTLIDVCSGDSLSRTFTD